MKSEKLQMIKNAYSVVKYSLEIKNISREDELQNEKLVTALAKLSRYFEDENNQLYEDRDDIYLYCGSNHSTSAAYFCGLSGKIVITKTEEEYESFVYNNIVLFTDLDFVPETSFFIEHVYHQVRADFQLEAFERDNEDIAKLYILKKYYKKHSLEDFT